LYAVYAGIAVSYDFQSGVPKGFWGGVVISDNTINNCAYSLFLMRTKNTILSGNTITGSVYTLIYRDEDGLLEKITW